MTTHAFRYSTLADARKGILLETCRTLARPGVNYVIAGGWVPVLRGGPPGLSHPGTHDVDVLLSDEKEVVAAAVRSLRDAGYVPSAKHPFQLLKTLSVEAEQLVFNIDLMHPGETNQDMFHDIVDLGVREDYDRLETHIIKSISLPSARIVFDESLWSQIDVEGILPDGQHTALTVPLVDEVGLVLSKCGSVAGVKRERDAFDIYYLLAGPNGPKTAERLGTLATQFPQVADQIARLQDYISRSPAEFSRRVKRHLLNEVDIDPAAFVAELLGF